MQHLVAHSVPPYWLIHDWHEAATLWSRVLALGPIHAAVIMPDHVHVVMRRPRWPAWLGCLSGYARWRNHRRGEQGRAVWLPTPPPEPLRSRKHLDRSIRYVHLNPCRDHLVGDPLAWAYSTHRDAVGLALPGILAPERDPFRFHAYVSSDPSVTVDGTDLPFGLRGMHDHTTESVEAAVSALTRTTMDDLRRRGPARTLLIQALVELTPQRAIDVARLLDVAPSTITRTPHLPRGDGLLIGRVAGDHRFGPLYDQPLTGLPEWRRYRDGRVHRGAYAKLVELAAPRLHRRNRSQRPSCI